jgi:hypothetical protein
MSDGSIEEIVELCPSGSAMMDRGMQNNEEDTRIACNQS